MKGDAETSLQELKDLMVQFRKERGWDKHLTPKNLAISISLEAAELLEHYQWDEYSDKDSQAVADELADVIITCFSLATVLDVDIASTFRHKLERIKKKYPVTVFNPDTDNEAEYFRIKKSYRQKGGTHESR